MKHLVLLGAVSLVLQGTERVQADFVSAIDIQHGSSTALPEYGTAGWEFTTNQAITVDALAACVISDNFGTTVQIYDGSGNVYATANVTQSDPTDAAGLFNFQSITPIVLPAGGTFFIASYVTLEDYLIIDATPATTNPGINYVGGVVSLGGPIGVVGDPTTGTAFGPHNPSFFGPSFEISASSVPEPSGLVLLGLGTVGALCFGWRRRKHSGVSGSDDHLELTRSGSGRIQ
jgi:hypothetical protein